MRKIILLITIIAIFSNCSNKKEFIAKERDIIGVWKITKSTFNGAAIEMDNCTAKSILEVSVNRVGALNMYYNLTPCQHAIEVFSFSNFKDNNFDINGSGSNPEIQYYGTFITPRIMEITTLINNTYNTGKNKNVYTFEKTIDY
jgi:hypothetical protein